MMTKRALAIIGLIICYCQIQGALAGAKIIRVSGEVKARRGVEESWQPTIPGMLLEEIDTILTGANGEVVLETAEGVYFKLGKNASLDISDLRKITEKELFLYLMSIRIQKMAPGAGKTQLRIGNVSVVHGESKAKSDSSLKNQLEPDFWSQEKNGAVALHDQKLYPNSIIKFHKILDRYGSRPDCGEIHFYLGQSFEAIENPGQAIDAYQMVIHQSEAQHCENPDAKRWLDDAQKAINRLKPKQ